MAVHFRRHTADPPPGPFFPGQDAQRCSRPASAEGSSLPSVRSTLLDGAGFFRSLPQDFSAGRPALATGLPFCPMNPIQDAQRWSEPASAKDSSSPSVDSFRVDGAGSFRSLPQDLPAGRPASATGLPFCSMNPILGNGASAFNSLPQFHSANGPHFHGHDSADLEDQGGPPQAVMPWHQFLAVASLPSLFQCLSEAGITSVDLSSHAIGFHLPLYTHTASLPKHHSPQRAKQQTQHHAPSPYSHTHFRPPHHRSPSSKRSSLSRAAHHRAFIRLRRLVCIMTFISRLLRPIRLSRIRSVVATTIPVVSPDVAALATVAPAIAAPVFTPVIVDSAIASPVVAPAMAAPNHVMSERSGTIFGDSHVSKLAYMSMGATPRGGLYVCSGSIQSAGRREEAAAAAAGRSVRKEEDPAPSIAAPLPTSLSPPSTLPPPQCAAAVTRAKGDVSRKRGDTSSEGEVAVTSLARGAILVAKAK